MRFQGLRPASVAGIALLLVSCNREPNVPPPPPPPPPPPAEEAEPTEANLPEWAPGENMREALVSIVTTASLAATRNYGFDDQNICVVGAFLMPHEKATIIREFQGGVDYALIGGGTRLATDVDLAVSDDKGRVLQQDTLKDVTPIVHFRPKVTAEYKIALVLQSAVGDSGSFVAAAVMRAGAAQLPAERLDASIGGMLHRARTVAALVKQKQGMELYFHMGRPRGWALYSAVVQPKHQMTYTAIRPDRDELIVIGGGDQAAQDINLAVEQNDQVLEKDVERDATPLVVMKVVPQESYDIIVANIASNGPSLVTTLVLEPEKE